MKKLFLLACASLILTACGAVAEKTSGEAKTGAGDKFRVGDQVLFKASAVAYNEGVIEKVEGAKYEIRSGSNIAKADAADVYALPKAGAKTDAKAGDIVAAFSNDVYWAAGEVKNANGDVVEIEKATGGKLNAAPDKLIKVSPTATADIKQEIAKKTFEDTGKTKKPVLPKDWKPKKGEKIAAQWSFGSWHTAIIKNVNPNNIDIDWQNGWNDGTVAADKIAPVPTAAEPLPNAGDYIIVKPQSDLNDWKFAVVTAINGQEAEVKLADGKTQKLRIGDFITMF